ncbi:hypothetical protein HMPREF9120_01965 [Neisseria sp. oral taxon 020 str. F0370]|nr:hypothetical protein HMPREF9120_01965 [Neisseria sp. oral taxon 020 str. F0370]
MPGKTGFAAVCSKHWKLFFRRPVLFAVAAALRPSPPSRG